MLEQKDSAQDDVVEPASEVARDKSAEGRETLPFSVDVLRIRRSVEVEDDWEGVTGAARTPFGCLNASALACCAIKRVSGLR